MRRIVGISLAFLSACMVGPRYETPQTSFAPSFSESAGYGEAEIDLKTWWTQFGDPVLDAMIQEAVERNYDLKIAMERIAEARARYQYEGANLWPEIDVTGGVERERISQNLSDSPFLGPAVQNFFTLGFDASWEIDLFGRLRSLKEAALDEFQATQENYRDVYITLVAEIVRNYALLRSLQEEILLTQERIEVSKEELFLSASRYRAGLKSQIEPLDSEGRLDGFNASLFPLQAEMQTTLYSLAVLLGRQPEEIPEEWLKRAAIPKAAGKIPVGLPSDLLRRRPDIRKAERELASATAQIGAYVALLFPSFSLSAFFGYQSSEASEWFKQGSQTWSVGPNASWPFIDFGRIRSQINLQNAVQREALDNYEQTVLNSLKDVESALASYSREEKRLQSLSLQAANLQAVSDRASSLYRAGLASFSDFLDAKQNWLASEQERVKSEQSLSLYLVAVYKSLGGEWECCSTP